jgi:hypothetical protein
MVSVKIMKKEDLGKVSKKYGKRENNEKRRLRESLKKIWLSNNHIHVCLC